ncbi:MAG: helix-turn-helix domain-containing protein [Prevotella sp.]|jgi:DNA-binding CsgD family transcriptional regulator
MESNNELRTAWDFIEYTGISIFLTGKAGTGKTTFLKTVKENTMKRMIVVAPTGVAAINAGGVTIHSFFQLPLTPYIPGATVKERFNFSRTKRNIIRTLDMLVIDEISMVRADLLDAVDSVLRRYRDATQPFGGVQLVMIGDLQQLTPVVTPEDEQLLRPYYDTPYFFGSKALKQINYVTIQLTHVFRQQDEDFIRILNHVREGKMDKDDYRQLNARCLPGFVPPQDEGYIRLTTHNHSADNYNAAQLASLKGKAWSFKAAIEGKFPEYSYPTDVELVVKVGAQVMFVKNDGSGAHEYYNGLIGRITNISEEGIEVKCPNRNPIVVGMQEWENTTYTLNDETKEIETTVQGTFSQYPLRLAWAITIHKSQGLTFEHAIIDAGRSFASGQVYVALSRCKSLEGMVLTSPIGNEIIIRDQRVSDYISHQQDRTEKSIEALPQLREEYYRSLLLELFDFQQLFGAEQMLHHHLLEFFHDFNRLANFHGSTIDTLDQKLMKVAYKWTAVIRGMESKQLHETDFLERVKHSATYFHEVLTDNFPRLLELTKMASTGNKKAMERMDELYKNLWLLYKAKDLLLVEASKHTFDVPFYLRTKQETLLDAMDIVSPGSVSSKRRRKGKVASNPYDRDEGSNIIRDRSKDDHDGREVEGKSHMSPKVPSREVSFQLFKTGKSIEEIARERGLASSTIYGHLMPFLKTGQLSVSDFVSAEHEALIRQAFAKLGNETSIKAIREYCSETVSYEEIRAVSIVMKHS